MISSFDGFRIPYLKAGIAVFRRGYLLASAARNTPRGNKGELYNCKGDRFRERSKDNLRRGIGEDGGHILDTAQNLSHISNYPSGLVSLR